MDNRLYRDFVNILGEELLPAMGCTEPISIAYAAALARDALGEIPERTEISVSGNILKNVKSVVVPNTGGMKGVTCAAAAGIIAGDSSKKLEVIAGVTAAEVQKIAAYLKTASFSVEHSRSGCVFDIGVKVYKGENSAFVRIVGHHTNVVLVQKNGESVFSSEAVYEENSCRTDRSILMNMAFLVIL